ncbi:MAG TPA: MBL fold metallo-hydrolase [Oscillatoriales cyanobacterium M59_W2019_021]|nr:MAG: Zn-dependent hydrolase [Cyanobacteria bacterium J055]HIK32843.1 MBL fold metallo-hydrolase [Oscillatoriales cyanobacterium M4454_W2019_049]HIK52100.1 MBL fold metallo-hydrolase [Oscillatoriales cyanobacterium M59_W2019_021]
MKRRQALRYLQTGALAAATMAIAARTSQAQTNNSLIIRWFGHTCFLFSGGDRKILVNPFRPIGCTAGYRTPTADADLVLVSSLLLDEGNLDGLPEDQKLLFEPGAYRLGNLQFQGIKTDHDDRGGRQFGSNIVWGWMQAGIKILHLGGAAAPINFDQQILMGRPDVLLLPVGGGPKAYDPQEAVAAMELLSPKIVIPTHYRTQAADTTTCEIQPLDDFLALVSGKNIRRVGSDTISLTPSDLPDNGTDIVVLSYQF